MAARLRKLLDSSDDDPADPAGGNIPQFIEDSFSLDYLVKAWWTEKDSKFLDILKREGT